MRWLTQKLKDNTVLFGPVSEVDCRDQKTVSGKLHLSLKGRIRNAFIRTFPAEEEDSTDDLGVSDPTNFFGASGNNKGALRKVLLAVKVPVITVINVIRFAAEFIPHVFESAFKHLLVSSKRGLQYARGFTGGSPLDGYNYSTPTTRGKLSGLKKGLKKVGLFLLGVASVVGIMIGAAVYYPLKAARLLIRTVTSPVASYNDAFKVHLVLGVLSGVISCAAYVVAAFFLSPVALIFGAKVAHVGVATKVVSQAPKVGGITAGVGSSAGMTVTTRWQKIKGWFKKKFGKRQENTGVQTEAGEKDRPLRERSNSNDSTVTTTTASSEPLRRCGQRQGRGWSKGVDAASFDAAQRRGIFPSPRSKPEELEKRAVQSNGCALM